MPPLDTDAGRSHARRPVAAKNYRTPNGRPAARRDRGRFATADPSAHAQGLPAREAVGLAGIRAPPAAPRYDRPGNSDNAIDERRFNGIPIRRLGALHSRGATPV